MKSPMNLVFRILVVCAITVFALNQEVSAQTKANRPAKEPYASMSITEKQKVQKKLIAQLKTDTDFIAIEKIMNGIVDESIERRSKGIKSSSVDKNSNTPESGDFAETDHPISV